jgi:hypothetical protein
MMSTVLKIDHVTIAGSTLASLEQGFAAVGLPTEYGGPHSNGVTHMALLGFEDGSYIELISSLEPNPQETFFWSQQIAGNGGPCAWAIQSDDVVAETARLAAAGITVKGPVYMHRRRPDGALVEWDLAFLGDLAAGATLPFIIKDITPRERRVQPSAGVTGRLTGVAMVILGVENLADTIELFRRVYGWSVPQFKEDVVFKARLAHFAGTPVTLASPLAKNDWLAERLARFGPSPCAYLLSSVDFEAASRDFGLMSAQEWFGRRAAWFDPAKLNGIKLGVIA